ncbi:MAG TPA: TetR/AcrR family transcriptional regulator [Pyrinomonadaceae bacterium]|nr:TetR/AcrR family transcriptional regulator [Pyrinomonadaceae bacterium]
MSKQTSAVPSDPPLTLTSRMAGEERRLQILRVAMNLFSQHGFRGTTTKEIAHAAGVSEAMVFRHFATKEELYTAILDHKACASGLDLCEMAADAVARKDDRAVFEGLAYAALQHHEHDTEFHRLLLHSALEGHELAQMFWERNVLRIYEFLGAYIRERQRDGAFREIEPRIVIRAFIGMVIHHSLNNTLWDPSRRLLDVTNEQAAREFTEILLSGINAAAPSRSETGKRASAAKRPAKKKQTK